MLNSFNNDGRYDSTLDAMTFLSFFIGLENLSQNTEQIDMQKIADDMGETLSSAIQEIHKHLEEQDNKIDLILKELRK